MGKKGDVGLKGRWAGPRVETRALGGNSMRDTSSAGVESPMAWLTFIAAASAGNVEGRTLGTGRNQQRGG